MFNCMDYCNYSFKNNGTGIGYCVNSNDHRFNSAKRELNQKLINGKESIFLKTLILEIKKTNSKNIRINSIGDFEFNKNGIKQFNKIQNLVRRLSDVDFWLTTHNDFILNSVYAEKNQELKNLSVQLSHPEPNGIWNNELLKYWNNKNISCTSTTRFKNRSNCDKSTKKSDGCDGCHKCNLLHNTVFYIHGKYGKSRLRKYEKINRGLK